MLGANRAALGSSSLLGYRYRALLARDSADWKDQFSENDCFITTNGDRIADSRGEFFNDATVAENLRLDSGTVAASSSALSTVWTGMQDDNVDDCDKWSDNNGAAFTADLSMGSLANGVLDGCSKSFAIMCASVKVS